MNFEEWYRMLKLLKNQKLDDIELTLDNAIIAMHFNSMVVSIRKEDFDKLYISPSVLIDKVDELDYKKDSD